MSRFPVFPQQTLAIACVVAALFAATQTSEEIFFLLAADSHSSAPWRWITSHLVHTDLTHLTLNLAGLIILGVLLEQHKTPALWLVLLAGCGSVQLWFVWQHEANYYCGLSGVLCALLAGTLVFGYQTNKRWCDISSGNAIMWLIAAIVGLKLAIELSTSARLTFGMSWPSAPGAHLAGFTGGVIASVAYRTLIRRRSAEAIRVAAGQWLQRGDLGEH